MESTQGMGGPPSDPPSGCLPPCRLGGEGDLLLDVCVGSPPSPQLSTPVLTLGTGAAGHGTSPARGGPRSAGGGTLCSPCGAPRPPHTFRAIKQFNPFAPSSVLQGGQWWGDRETGGGRMGGTGGGMEPGCPPLSLCPPVPHIPPLLVDAPTCCPHDSPCPSMCLHAPPPPPVPPMWCKALAHPAPTRTPGSPSRGGAGVAPALLSQHWRGGA